MYLKVYCILAHKNPVQIQELIALLEDGKSLFFIHLDKKVDQREYKLLQNSSCHFVKNKISCTWGKYSLVQATLNGMQEVLDFMNAEYGGLKYHFIMLSGEDLPLKNNNYIHTFLENNVEGSFLHHWQLPYSKWWGGGWFRLENVYFFEYKKHQKYNYWLSRLIKKLHLDNLLPLNQFKRHFPSFKIYGSSQWMILNQDLLAFVLNTNKNNPQFNAVFKNVLAPDELYFATLVLNFDTQKQFVLNNSATHLVCFEGLDSSPKYLSTSDIKNNDSENWLFARKFDASINNEAIMYVKQIISQ